MIVNLYEFLETFRTLFFYYNVVGGQKIINVSLYNLPHRCEEYESDDKFYAENALILLKNGHLVQYAHTHIIKLNKGINNKYA